MQTNSPYGVNDLDVIIRLHRKQNNKIQKAKVYVKNPQDVPPGFKVERGKRGGYYYESSESIHQQEIPTQSKRTKYESNIPGLYGRLPNFDSMPNKISIPNNNVKTMDKIRQESHLVRKEIAYSIDRRAGGFLLPNTSKRVGDNKGVMAVPGKFGSYHTHPGIPDKDFINSLSFEDIKPLCQYSGQLRHKIAIAQNSFDGKMWVAIGTSNNFRMDGIQSEMIWNMAYKMCDRTSNEGYRKSIKKFVDKMKIKLYYGTPDNLEEYDGSW